VNIKIQISRWKKHGISNKEEVKIGKSHFDKELGFAYSLFSSVYFPFTLFYESSLPHFFT